MELFLIKRTSHNILSAPAVTRKVPKKLYQKNCLQRKKINLLVKDRKNDLHTYIRKGIRSASRPRAKKSAEVHVCTHVHRFGLTFPKWLADPKEQIAMCLTCTHQAPDAANLLHHPPRHPTLASDRPAQLQLANNHPPDAPNHCPSQVYGNH